MKTTQISNGVNLHFIDTKKFKTTIICFLIRRPLLREEVTSNSLIANILKNGSKKYNTISKLNSVLEDMYGAIFDVQIIKMGQEQILQFYIEILNKDIDKTLLEKALKFLNSIILENLIQEEGFNLDIFNNEKENLKNKINSKINNKSEYIKFKCIEEMYKDEPFSLQEDGYIEDLKNINNKNLYTHYKKILKNSPIEIIVMGDENEQEIKNHLEEIFIFERENIININNNKFFHKNKDKVIKKENLNISQAKICLGLKSLVDEYENFFYELLVFNEILGGGPSSKLFINIRENEGLCYSIYSFVYRFKKIIMIQAGIDKENFKTTIDLIEKQIKDIGNENISIEEFKIAKDKLINNFKSIKDYQSATINFYISEYILSSDKTIEEAIEIIENISKNEVSEIAKKFYVDTIYLVQ